MKRKRVYALAVLIVLLASCLLAQEIYRSNRCLHVDRYQITTDKVDEPIRIVQLSDLHNTEFGAENEELLAMVAAEQPDLILFTGDLVTGRVKDTAVAMKLVEKLTQVAPVYISLGNHERMHQNHFGSDLSGMLEYRGAKVLEFAYEDIRIREQNLRIGGISGFCVPEKYLYTGEAKVPECEFLKDMADTEVCTLLMCHYPLSWIANDAISYWDIDLVFSGHAHGGQWVIPLLGPVIAPDMGLFPGRVEGLFPSADGSKHLVVSSGLGNSLPVPRLNNGPQILVLDILPA